MGAQRSRRVSRVLCIMFIVENLREVNAVVLYAERLARSGDKKLRRGGGAWLVAQLTKAYHNVPSSHSCLIHMSHRGSSRGSSCQSLKHRIIC
jgi:hypothetical protein